MFKNKIYKKLQKSRNSVIPFLLCLFLAFMIAGFNEIDDETGALTENPHICDLPESEYFESEWHDTADNAENAAEFSACISHATLCEMKMASGEIFFDSCSFSVVLPQTWENKYTVERKQSEVLFYDKANHNSRGGLLFGIKKSPVEEMAEIHVMDPTYRKDIVTVGAFTYYLTGPSGDMEPQWEVGNSDLQNEYFSMYSDINTILSSFVYIE